MLTWFRLSYALHRFELRLLIVAAAATVVATLWVAAQMSDTRSAQLACIREANALAAQVADAHCREFQPIIDGFVTIGGFLGLAAGAAPFLLGLVLGVPLVAAEVEKGTASTAWTLSGSRLRWLMRRLVPMIVVVGVVELIIGQAGDALARAYPAFDGADPGFGSYGMRGPLLVVRGVAVLLIGSAIGALMGRTLPAILASAAICLAIFIGLFMFTDQLMRAEAIPLSLGAAQLGASQAYDTGYRDDVTGEITTFEDYYQVHGDGPMSGGEVPGMTMVAYAVPGSRYVEFVRREAGVLGGISLVSLGLVLVVVQRRRPY